MKIEVGKEYEYLGQFVKVLCIYGPKDEDEYREVLIETRFGDRTTVWAGELSPKPTRQ